MKKQWVLLSFLVLSFLCRINLCATDEAIEEQNRNYFQAFVDFVDERMKAEFGLEGDTHTYRPEETNLFLSFYARRRANLDEARALEMVVQSQVEELAHVFKQNHPEPSTFSINPAFIRVYIKFINAHGWSYHDGSLSSSCVMKDPDNPEKWKIHYNAPSAFRHFLYSGENIDDDFPTSIEESSEEVERLNALAAIANPAMHYPQPFEEEMDKVTVLFKEEMQQYGLYINNLGWMEPGKDGTVITKIRTNGTYRGIVGLQKARALVLKASSQLLQLLNDNERLCPYFLERPFSVSHLKLQILFRKYKSFVGWVRDHEGGSVDSATLNNGKITFIYIDPSTSEVIEQEASYPEAQEILENTPAPAIPETIACFFRKLTYFLEDVWTWFWICVAVLFFFIQ